MVATFLGNPTMNLRYGTYQNGGFHLKGQRLPCPSHFYTVLNKIQSQTIDIGIRPEFIQIVSAPAEGTLSVTVEVVEPLGRETLIRAFLTSKPNQTLNLVAKSSFASSISDCLSIRPDLSQLMIFDPQTGDRLT
jgi:multiple sugar transport system ATP-binding protein